MISILLLTLLSTVNTIDNINNTTFDLLYKYEADKDNYNLALVDKKYMDSAPVLKVMVNIGEQFNVRYITTNDIAELEGEERSYEEIIKDKELLFINNIKYYLSVVDRKNNLQTAELFSTLTSERLHSRIIPQGRDIKYLAKEIEEYNQRMENITQAIKNIHCGFPANKVLKNLGPADRIEKFGIEHYWGNYTILIFENYIIGIKDKGQTILQCDLPKQ